MEEERWHPGSFASLGPRLAEIFHLVPVFPSEDVIGLSLPDHTSPQESVSGVGHHNLAAFAILRGAWFQSNDTLRKVELFSTQILQLAYPPAGRCVGIGRMKMQPVPLGRQVIRVPLSRFGLTVLVRL